jgi:arginyl-tRNA synthetase
VPDPIAQLRATIVDAAQALHGGGAEPTLERPPRDDLGDYSTNAPMLLAPALGEQPRQIAERLREALAGSLGDEVERIEVAGPGFVNLWLGGAWYRRALREVLAAGDRFGAGGADPPQRTLIEFVSANPTGPLTAAGGRHAAYGDALARLLALRGHEVWREYYVNDTGLQVRLFAQSIAARMTGAQIPEGGYEGPYVIELAERLAAEGAGPDELDRLEVRGTELMLEQVRDTLERFGAAFDEFFSERTLHGSGGVEAALAELRDRGHVYESEGATWLKTSELGDDKDRVLVRSGGDPTYFLADVAYHSDKLRRGWERLIDVLGADHHGYVPRMRAALQALGADPESFEALIMQLVQIVEKGERQQMSKRKGEFVALDELLDDIGVDATRWFMLQKSHDHPVDLDLELARKQSNDNPVYYAQYAHARVSGILLKAEEEVGEGTVRAALAADLSAAEWPVEPAERALLKRLLEFPQEVEEAAAKRAPHRLCAYAMSIAADFHPFYRDCQVVAAETELLRAARLALCVATKQTIARTLALLGVTAPERM